MPSQTFPGLPSQSSSFTQQFGISSLTQPEAGSQVSMVQKMPSSQFVGVVWQPSSWSQVSSVQGLPSSQ